MGQLLLLVTLSNMISQLVMLPMSYVDIFYSLRPYLNLIEVNSSTTMKAFTTTLPTN